MTSITKAIDLVAEARTRIENLTPAEVEAEAAADGVLLVDLREPTEIAELGTVPGAVHVPRGLLEFCADPAFPKYRDEFQPGRRTILYCASGGRSALAVETLRTMGYTNVAHLDGGFAAWAEAGCPVVTTGA